jgi:hypothetical protein
MSNTTKASWPSKLEKSNVFNDKKQKHKDVDVEPTTSNPLTPYHLSGASLVE